MAPIRHHLAVLGALILLGIVAGIGAAIWTGVAVVIAIGINRCSGLVSLDAKAAGPLIWGLIALSFVAVAAGSVILYLQRGWLSAVACPLLFFLFSAVKEDRWKQSERDAASLREALYKEVSACSAGRLTREQLEERSRVLLSSGLPEHAFYMESVQERLLRCEAISPGDYKVYLEILEKHLARIPIYAARPDLLKAVRARLAG